jgi:hypothetical protein
MIAYYPSSYNEETEELETKVFNSSEFEDNYDSATKGNLKDYAHKYQTNLFTSVNYFSDIFVNSINGVSDTVLGYLQNITQDVQQSLNTLNGEISTIHSDIDDVNETITTINTTLTDITYDEENDVTMIQNNLYAETISTNNNLAVSNNCAISGTLSASTINNQKLITNEIVTGKLVSNEISCKGKMSSYSDVGCYLFVVVNIPATGQTYVPSLITIPLMKSQFINTIFAPTSPFSFIVTLKNGYSIEFYDAEGFLIGSLNNVTDDFIYNRSLLFNIAPYRVVLKLDNIILY